MLWGYIHIQRTTKFSNLRTQEALSAMTHWPLFDTLLQVAFRAPIVGMGIHAYPAAHVTDIMASWVETGGGV